MLRLCDYSYSYSHQQTQSIKVQFCDTITNFSYKNGSLARERVCNENADGSWDTFTESLESTPMGNNGCLGRYDTVISYILAISYCCCAPMCMRLAVCPEPCEHNTSQAVRCRIIKCCRFSLWKEDVLFCVKGSRSQSCCNEILHFTGKANV